MKRVLAILLILTSSYIFAQNPFSNPMLNSYYQHLSTLSLDQVSSVEKSINQFQNHFKYAPKSTADSAYVIFEEFILEILNQVEFDYKKIMDLQNPDSSKKFQQANSYVQWLNENGFSYKETKNDIIIVPNLAKIKKMIYPYLSDELLSYFDKVEKESSQGYILNDSLVISPFELANRCLYWETFIFEHPNFIMSFEVKQRYNSYLETLIFGTPKTPIFVGKKNKIHPDFKKTYQNLLKTHPFSFTGDILERYVFILKKYDFKENMEAEMFTWKSL